MYESHLLTPAQERPRSTRSHSLKPISQPNALTQRKRLYSLPSKPVIPPHITIQACQDCSQDSNSDEEEMNNEWSHESMGKRGKIWVYEACKAQLPFLQEKRLQETVQ